MRFPSDHNGVLYLRTSPPVLRLKRRGPGAGGEDTGGGEGADAAPNLGFTLQTDPVSSGEVRGHLPAKPRPSVVSAPKRSHVSAAVVAKPPRKRRPASFQLTLKVSAKFFFPKNTPGETKPARVESHLAPLPSFAFYLNLPAFIGGVFSS